MKLKIILLLVILSLGVGCSPINPYLLIAEYKRLQVKYPLQVKQCEDELGKDTGLSEIINCAKVRIYGEEKMNRVNLDDFTKSK